MTARVHKKSAQKQISGYFKVKEALSEYCGASDVCRHENVEWRNLATDVSSDETMKVYKRRTKNGLRIACAPTPSIPQLGEQVSEVDNSNLEDLQDAGPEVKKPKATKRKRLDQYFLDFGQKDITCKRCNDCGFVYSVGLEDDEKMHTSFHKTYTMGVGFMGWKKERLVKAAEEGDRIVITCHFDSVQQRNKVEEVASFVERDLGTSPSWLMSGEWKAYLFIRCKRVIGCAFTAPEDKSSACQHGLLREDDVCMKRANKSSSAPPRCCIRALWVVPGHRRKGVATQLLDAVRISFLYGRRLPSSELTFLAPTEDGKRFAAAYCGTTAYNICQ